MQIRENGLLNDFYPPNFPLYANVISPIGVYFAQTKKGEMGMKGVQYLENENFFH